MLTERQAWKLLAEGYDNPIQPEPQGLCARLHDLRRIGRITYGTQVRMHGRIFEEGRRLGNEDTDTALGYLWPLGEAGREERRAFCRRMEKAVRRKGDILLALAISFGLIVIRLCLRALGW